MNGAKRVTDTLVELGVELVFLNPGTTELYLVSALEKEPSIELVSCLHETVCAGAADGYSRMSGKTAVVLIHQSIGVANAICNLHNARVAGSAVLVLIGENPPSHSNKISKTKISTRDLAQSVCRKTFVPKNISELERELRFCLGGEPLGSLDDGFVNSIVISSNLMWQEPVNSLALAERKREKEKTNFGEEDNAIIASQITERSAILVDGKMAYGENLSELKRISDLTGCRLLAPTFAPRIESGPNLPWIERLPYFPEACTSLLNQFDVLYLLNSDSPTSYFGYEDGNYSLVPSTTRVVNLGQKSDDSIGIVKGLYESLLKSQRRVTREAEQLASMRDLASRTTVAGSSAINAENFAHVVSLHAPKQLIVSQDTAGFANAVRNSLGTEIHCNWLNLAAGAIGQGGPVAVGAALACPQNTIFAIMGDGSTMYSPQYLWTAAKYSLNIITLIISNRRYRVLDIEFERANLQAEGKESIDAFDLGSPAIDWVDLSKSLGVRATKVLTVDELSRALVSNLAVDGPSLIEVSVE